MNHHLLKGATRPAVKQGIGGDKCSRKNNISSVRPDSMSQEQHRKPRHPRRLDQVAPDQLRDRVVEDCLNA